MICPQCGKTVYRMISRLRDGKWVDGCKSCSGYATIVDVDANQTYYVSRVTAKGRPVTRRYTRGEVRHMDKMTLEPIPDGHHLVEKRYAERKSFMVGGLSGNR